MTERLPLAAEQVLRLLEGEEAMEARRFSASDPAFAADVLWWEDRLAPLFDEIPEVEPSGAVWPGIVRRVSGEGGGSIVALRRQLTRWRAGAAAAAVAAAVLLGLQLRPERPMPLPVPQPSRPAPLLLASLAGEDAPEALTVAFRPDTRELVITPARVTAPADRARELWLIPEGAQPISLGLVGGEGVQRRLLPAALAARFATGATVALSDEPEGGSPTGQPTGSVLAAGALTTV